MSEQLRKLFLIEKEKWATKSYADIDRREWEEQVNYEVRDGEYTCYFEVLLLEHTEEYIHVEISAWDSLLSSIVPLGESIIYRKKEPLMSSFLDGVAHRLRWVLSAPP